MKEAIRAAALGAGFAGAAFLAPFTPGAGLPDRYREGSPGLLAAALVYGNCFEEPPAEAAGERRAWIAPFARRNYYREAVGRLQGLAKEFRANWGGRRADFRIFCNSPVPEKPLALAAGLGSLGRNGLVLTQEAGSLFIIAAMTLPYALAGDGPREGAEGGFPLCSGCDPARPPCAAACPTGALRGDGTLERARCIQWYASGHGAEVPPDIRRLWGKRLYGCTECQDACVLNRRPVRGVTCTEGPLPAFLDPGELVLMDDDALRARFRGTCLGLSWPGPAAIRRNAALVLEGPTSSGIPPDSRRQSGC